LEELSIGVIASIIGAIFLFIIQKFITPWFTDYILYKGIKVTGSWNIIEQRNGKHSKVGSISLKQKGKYITGSSTRTKTRDGKISTREFEYKGTISGNQVNLMFEDKAGNDFDSGSYVFTVKNDKKVMVGMATFHGKKENRIISESRTLEKVLT